MKCKSEVKKPLKTFSISEERVRSLENVLDNYLDVFKEPKLKDQIIKSFSFKIPVAYIKLYDRKTEQRTKLIEALEDFFFVGEVYFYSEPKESKLFGVILVSRFKDLLDVALYYAKKHNGQLDRFSDLSHVLSGKPLEDIAKYCSPERIKELEKVLGNYLDIFDDGGTIDQVLRAPFTLMEKISKKFRRVTLKFESYSILDGFMAEYHFKEGEVQFSKQGTFKDFGIKIEAGPITEPIEK